MGNNKKEQFDVSDLGASLPAAAAGTVFISYPKIVNRCLSQISLNFVGLIRSIFLAALSAEDRAGLVNALKVFFFFLICIF